MWYLSPPGDPTEFCVVVPGEVGSIYTFDTSALTMTGGRIFGHLGANGSSTMTVSDGIVDGSIGANNSATITISGGDVSGGMLNANHSSTITVIGGGFEVDGSSVP